MRGVRAVSLLGLCWKLTSTGADWDAAGEGAWTHIDGAAQERALLQGLLDDPEQAGRGLPQLITLGDASSEVLEALAGGTPGKCFITPVDPVGRGETL